MKRVWTFYHLKLTQSTALARERVFASTLPSNPNFITSFNLGSYSNFYYYILLLLLLLLLLLFSDAYTTNQLVYTWINGSEAEKIKVSDEHLSELTLVQTQSLYGFETYADG